MISIRGLKIRNFPKNPEPHFFDSIWKRTPKNRLRRNLSYFGSIEIFLKSQESRKSGIFVSGDFCVGVVCHHPWRFSNQNLPPTQRHLRKNRRKRKCPIFDFLEFFKNISIEPKSLKFRRGRFSGVLFHIESQKVGVRIFREISYFQAPKIIVVSFQPTSGELEFPIGV